MATAVLSSPAAAAVPGPAKLQVFGMLSPSELSAETQSEVQFQQQQQHLVQQQLVQQQQPTWPEQHLQQLHCAHPHHQQQQQQQFHLDPCAQQPQQQQQQQRGPGQTGPLQQQEGGPSPHAPPASPPGNLYLHQAITATGQQDVTSAGQPAVAAVGQQELAAAAQQPAATVPHQAVAAYDQQAMAPAVAASGQQAIALAPQQAEAPTLRAVAGEAEAVASHLCTPRQASYSSTQSYTGSEGTGDADGAATVVGGTAIAVPDAAVPVSKAVAGGLSAVAPNMGRAPRQASCSSMQSYTGSEGGGMGQHGAYNTTNEPGPSTGSNLARGSESDVGGQVQLPMLVQQLGVSLDTLDRLFTAEAETEFEQPVWMVINLQGKIKGSYTAEKMIEFTRRGTLGGAQLALGMDRNLPYNARQELSYYRPISQLMVAVHNGARYRPLTEDFVKNLARQGLSAAHWEPLESPAAETTMSTGDTAAAAADLAAEFQQGLSLHGSSSAAAMAAGSSRVAAMAAAARLRSVLQRLCCGSGGRGQGGGRPMMGRRQTTLWMYINHLGWCRGPFSGGKVIQAHMCGRLPHDTLVVGLEPDVPPELISDDVDFWFRPMKHLIEQVAAGYSYSPVSWQDVAAYNINQQTGQGSAPQWQPLVYHDTGNPPPFHGGPQPSLRPNNNFRAPLAGKSSSCFGNAALMQSMPMQQCPPAAAEAGTASTSSGGGSGGRPGGMLGSTQYNRDVLSAPTSSSAWSSDMCHAGTSGMGSSHDQGTTTTVAAGAGAGAGADTGLPLDASQMYLTTDGSTWPLQISPTGSMTAGTPQEQAAAAAAAAPASLGAAGGMLLPMSTPAPASAAGVSAQHTRAGQGSYPDAGALQGSMSQALLMQLLQPQGASAAQQGDATAAAAAAAAAALQMQPLQLLQTPGGFAGMPQQQGNAALQLQPGFAAAVGPTVYMPQVATQQGMAMQGVMPAPMGWCTAQQLQLQQAMLQGSGMGAGMGIGPTAATMGGAEGAGVAEGAAAASQAQLLQQQFWGQQQLHSMTQHGAQNWPMAGGGTGTGVVGPGFNPLQQQQGGADVSSQGQYAGDSMQQGLLNGVLGNILNAPAWTDMPGSQQMQ